MDNLTITATIMADTGTGVLYQAMNAEPVELVLADISELGITTIFSVGSRYIARLPSGAEYMIKVKDQSKDVQRLMRRVRKIVRPIKAGRGEYQLFFWTSVESL